MKPVPTLPGYFADERGTIWSAKPGRWGRYKKPHRISAWRDPGGYLRVNLRPTGKAKNFSVHLLVAEAFHGPCPTGLVCCHLNGKRYDNRPSNLKYVTQKENIGHKREHGTMIEGERSRLAKLTDAQAVELLSLLRTGDYTRQQLADRFGIAVVTVDAIRVGRIRKHLHGGASLPKDERPPIRPSLPKDRSERKPVLGFPGYEADADGNIYSVRDRGVRRWGLIHRVTQFPAKDGYAEVQIRKEGGKWGKATVHRLMALAWIGPKPDGYMVHHINGIRTDNRITNLEYVTGYWNAFHRDNKPIDD